VTPDGIRDSGFGIRTADGIWDSGFGIRTADGIRDLGFVGIRWDSCAGIRGARSVTM